MGQPGAAHESRIGSHVVRHLPTGDEAERRDRATATEIADRYPGYKACQGYPIEHRCPVLIPWLKASPLCYGCERTRKLELAAILDGSSVPIGEILASLTIESFKPCECGGDPLAPYHAESLMHLNFLAR